MSLLKRNRKRLACLVSGGVLLGQFSSAGGCLPNDYFAGLGGTVLELVVTTVALQAVENAIAAQGEQP